MDAASLTPSAKAQKQQAGPAAAAGGVFVDAITERHISTDPSALLQRRCLTHTKNHGWTYDVWIDDPGRYALTGAHSRFSLPAIAQRIAGVVTESTAAAGQQMHRVMQSLQQQRRQPQQQQQQQLRQQ